MKSDIWVKTLDKIKSMIDEFSFNNWFSKTEVLSIDDESITIICNLGPMHTEHLKNNYYNIIELALFEVTGNKLKLKFITTEDVSMQETKDDDSDLIVEDENIYFDNNLIEKYTFDNFTVGDSNKVAYGAAIMIASEPGKTYNPLFIYGNSGLGKTHLMHAIGNHIVKTSDKNVLYITCEQFINDFVTMSSKKDGDNFDYVKFFKQKYRGIDVLIIDDIQHLEVTNSSQKEFFNTFNSLYYESKQIIISSDSSPDDLKKLEEHLRTRFAWGLTTRINPPDFELRKDIIKNKIIDGEYAKEIPDEVIEYIATNIGGSVRNLEGAINRVFVYSAIYNSEITLPLAIDALKENVGKGTGEKNDINRIQKIVADYFEIDPDGMRSNNRKKALLLPRQIATYLCCKYTDENYSKIALEFGQVHSTVLHSKAKIERLLKNDKELQKIIGSLEKDINIFKH